MLSAEEGELEKEIEEEEENVNLKEDSDDEDALDQLLSDNANIEEMTFYGETESTFFRHLLGRSQCETKN